MYVSAVLESCAMPEVGKMVLPKSKAYPPIPAAPTTDTCEMSTTGSVTLLNTVNIVGTNVVESPRMWSATVQAVGGDVSAAVGDAVGTKEGTALGVYEGIHVGAADGDALGVCEGREVGTVEGRALGAADGMTDGTAEGSAVGTTVGICVGAAVGTQPLLANDICSPTTP